MKKNIILLIMLVFVMSCEKDPVPDPDVLPSALSYAVDSLVLELGTGANSVTPTLSGTEPYTFAMSSTPANGGDITIDETGTITAGASLTVGEYVLDVSVENVVGTVSFPDIFQIRVYEPGSRESA